MALFMIMCLFTTNAFAQEVRGIETRYVKAGATTEETCYCYESHSISKNVYDLYNVEFTNYNSIPVSVTLELYESGSESPHQTKDIILEPKESYVWKIKYKKSNQGLWDGCDCNTKRYYYVKYKAYKLQ